MQYRKLGKYGLELSAISLGTWATIGEDFSFKKAQAIFGTAYDFGINYFDTAETYNDGNAEIVLGKILKKFNWPRETYVISSKVFFGTYKKKPNTFGLSRKHVIEGCAATLKRLKLEYLDIYFCHRADLTTPIEETVLAMNTLINQGKILYWGTSEWTIEQFLFAYRFACENRLFPPVAEQLQYNMFHRKQVENEFSEIFNETGLGITAWSPLKSGLLVGKYKNQIPADSRLGKKQNKWLLPEVLGLFPEKRLKQVAELEHFSLFELGIPLKQLALAWCIHNKFITSAITGASEVEHILNMVKIFELGIVLTTDVIKRIDEIINFCPEEN